MFGIILFVLSVSGIIIINTNNSADFIIEEIKIDFGGVFGLKKIYTNILPEEEFRKISQSEYVREARDFSYTYKIHDCKIKINGGGHPDLSSENIKYPYGIYITGFDMDFFNIFTDENQPPELREGNIFKESDECVVSAEFADFVFDAGIKFSAGDKLTFEDIDTGKTKTFTVSGITVDSSENFLIYTSMENAIWLLNEFTSFITDENTGFAMLLYLYTYKDANKFTRDTNYMVERIYKEEFDSLVEPLEKTKEFNTTIMYILYFISVCVTAIMTMVILNERKYEIGVLLSMGMDKSKLTISLVYETVVFVTLTAAAGIAVGFIAAKLLNNSGDIFLNINTAIKILASGLGLSLISSLVSSLFIMRYRPMRILRSR